MGGVVWIVLRLLRGQVPGVVVLIASVIAGLAVVALTAARSGELRGTLAFLGRGVQTQE
jgi:hypothetical protein